MVPSIAQSVYAVFSASSRSSFINFIDGLTGNLAAPSLCDEASSVGAGSFRRRRRGMSSSNARCVSQCRCVIFKQLFVELRVVDLLRRCFFTSSKSLGPHLVVILVRVLVSQHKHHFIKALMVTQICVLFIFALVEVIVVPLHLLGVLISCQSASAFPRPLHWYSLGRVLLRRRVDLGDGLQVRVA